jgi:hypothetical protein
MNIMGKIGMTIAIIGLFLVVIGFILNISANLMELWK